MIKGIVFIFLTLFIFGHQVWASSCAPEDVISGEFLVRVQSSTSEVETKAAFKSKKNSFEYWAEKNGIESEKIGTKANPKNDGIGIQKISRNVSTYYLKHQDSAEQISLHPDVLSIEPNCKMHLMATPNDPLLGSQWALDAARIKSSWIYERTAANIIVAISDTGVEYQHEDLHENMWINPGETGTDDSGNIKETNGLDDDGNGYIDDIYGADTADNDGDPKPAKFRGAEHGTHVAGIVGAVGNNQIGIAGVAWNVKIMAIKGFKDNDKVANIADLLKTVYYAVDNGAQIINCSWGAKRTPSQAELDAFSYALSRDVIPVVAAGNFTEEASLYTPASIPGVVTVGAINVRREFSGFSNFGSRVDFLAPGGEVTTGIAEDYIQSTIPTEMGAYGNMRGTSMSSPFVAGALAILKSTRPSWTTEQLVAHMKKHSDLVTLKAPDREQTSGQYVILNLENTLKALVIGNDFEDNHDLDFPVDPGGTKASSSGGCGLGFTSISHSSALPSLLNFLIYLILFLLPVGTIGFFRRL